MSGNSATGDAVSPAVNTRRIIRPFFYRRQPTREVLVGQVGVGGTNPIRLQSMTIADTMDTTATVREAIQLYEAGSEIVRITAPGPKDAENLGQIKAALLDRGYDFPLVADIHFSPKAALIAVEHVEKVRINPGNFADKKKFKIIEYSDAAYEDELGRVRETFRPLLLRAKELGRAMRIGTNHGSLSDRIMNRFGDTPLGMVESALEFIRFAREEDYHSMVVSMKASNPQVMVQAYRLLAERFELEGFDYPLHLGVTEAGDGPDGRIKSAVGIGSLLNDGLGDTIRVSLTEDAVHELPAARRIAAPYQMDGSVTTSALAAKANLSERQKSGNLAQRFREAVNPYVYTRFLSEAVAAGGCFTGSKHQHRIWLPLAPTPGETPADFAARAAEYRRQGADAGVLALAADAPARNAQLAAGQSAGLPLFFDLSAPVGIAPTADPATLDAVFAHPRLAGTIVALDLSASADATESTVQLIHALLERSRSNAGETPPAVGLKLRRSTRDGEPDTPRELLAGLANRLAEILPAQILNDPLLWFSIDFPADPTRAARALAVALRDLKQQRELPPVALYTNAQVNIEDALYHAAIHSGGLLLDGIGDALWIAPPLSDDAPSGCSPETSEALLKLSLDLLQGVRLRLSRTEFISCPSCGRTLFDLQTTTARIKARTGHLKGVKIAVMGCIVNGPGEMADADFGYVGAGPGQIHLYKGKEIVKANLPSAVADEELVNLLKANDVWREPEEVK